MKFFTIYRDALGFLSLLPTGSQRYLEPDDFGRFPGFFPLVGLVLGLIFLLFWLLADLIFPAGVGAVFIAALMVILTRGFHLDGLADAADALFCHKTLEEKLIIMKDSRQGTFGVLAIVLAVLLKVVLLTYLASAGGRYFLVVLLLTPVWGRLAASVIAVQSVYARPDGGLGQFIVENSRMSDLWLAIVSALLLSIPFGFKTILGFLIILLFGVFLVWVWKKALNGVTGDLLGATVELGEIMSLLIFAAFI